MQIGGGQSAKRILSFISGIKTFVVLDSGPKWQTRF